MVTGAIKAPGLAHNTVRRLRQSLRRKRCNLNIIVRNNYFIDDVKIVVSVIIIDTRFMVIFH